LGRGQAPDSRNIETLVGPVTSPAVERLATLHVPEHNGAVIAATGQPAAVRAQPERAHHTLMRRLHLDARPAGHIPPAQLAVTVSAHHPVPTRSPGHRRNPARMLGQDADALPAAGIPNAELAFVADVAARGDPPVVEALGHARDDAAMSYQPQQQRVTPGVPDIDVAIFAHAAHRARATQLTVRQVTRAAA
jgi:hypothetical protein